MCVPFSTAGHLGGGYVVRPTSRLAVTSLWEKGALKSEHADLTDGQFR